jgi:hypothetical protein
MAALFQGQYKLRSTMDGFLLLLLEAAVALGLLLFIVWWTWPRRGPPEKRAGDAKKKPDQH